MVQWTWECKYLLNIVVSFTLEISTFRLILPIFKYCQLTEKIFKCCVSQTKHMSGLDPVTASVESLSNDRIKGELGVEPGGETALSKKARVREIPRVRERWRIGLGSRALMSHLRSQERSGLFPFTFLLNERITFIGIMLKYFIILYFLSYLYLYSYCQENK